MMNVSRWGLVMVAALLAAAGGLLVSKVQRFRGEREMLRASAQGNLPRVRILLKQGIGANTPSPDGDTALSLAAYGGHSDVVRLLLSRGADPNKSGGRFGDTALMWACYRGFYATAAALLSGGADPNRQAPSGATALHWAARRDRETMLALLVSSGAELDHPDRYGRTALIIAVRSRSTRAVRFLLSEGARSDLSDIYGKTAMDYARASKNPAIIGLVVPSTRVRRSEGASLRSRGGRLPGALTRRRAIDSRQPTAYQVR
jgi:uncharacterized protein